jgi:hypothetical protein
MKKILMIMLLTFTTMASADDARYTMLAKIGYDGQVQGVYILDTARGDIKYCANYAGEVDGRRVNCSKWEVAESKGDRK